MTIAVNNITPLLICKEIKKLLIDKDITQKEIAAHIGVVESLINEHINIDHETGEFKRKSIKTRKAIASYLDTPYETLWVEAEPTN